MGKETRRQTEIQAGDRLVMAEMIKDCMEPITPILIRTNSAVDSKNFHSGKKVDVSNWND